MNLAHQVAATTAGDWIGMLLIVAAIIGFTCFIVWVTSR